MDLYMKSGSKYVPISFSRIANDSWNDKVVMVRIGTDQNPASEDEVAQVFEYLNDAEVLEGREIGFLCTRFDIGFQVVSENDVKDQNVIVRVASGEDASAIADQKRVREMFRGLGAKKVIFLPAPITIKEYEEVQQIKRRCDVRRQRRGM